MVRTSTLTAAQWYRVSTGRNGQFVTNFGTVTHTYLPEHCYSNWISPYFRHYINKNTQLGLLWPSSQVLDMMHYVLAIFSTNFSQIRCCENIKSPKTLNIGKIHSYLPKHSHIMQNATSGQDRTGNT